MEIDRFCLNATKRIVRSTYRSLSYEPDMEDEPLAIEYREAEAGTLPVPHLPPGPAVTPVPMLYADALCGSTQDLPDIEYYKPKQSHSA